MRFTRPQERSALIDELVSRHHAGQIGALDSLWQEIYSEVHRMAHTMLVRGGPQRPVDTTVLVHELYLKMGGASFENRAHLFGSLARMMGQIVVDMARKQTSRRRLETACAVPMGQPALDPSRIGIGPWSDGQGDAAVVQLLDDLDEQAPRPAAVAWLRFVSGLSVEQVATCLDVSPRTVKTDWAFARAWLHRELVAKGLKPSSPKQKGDVNAE